MRKSCLEKDIKGFKSNHCHSRGLLPAVSSFVLFRSSSRRVSMRDIAKQLYPGLRPSGMTKSGADPRVLRTATSGMTSYTNAFTLIELLVVVLIVAILAAIAVPQFQLAIARTRFAELKVRTKYVAQYAQEYYLTNSTYDGSTVQLQKEQTNMESCVIWKDAYNFDAVRCCKTIFNVNTCMYFTRSTARPLYCLVYSTNSTDIPNKLCKQETGKSTGTPYTDSVSSYILYSY